MLLLILLCFLPCAFSLAFGRCSEDVIEACRDGDISEFERFVIIKTNVDCVDRYHTPCLHLLLDGGHWDAVDFLLQNGATATVIHPVSELNLLHRACYQGSFVTVQLAVSMGVSALDLDSNGRPPVFIAAMNGHTQVVDFLLSNVTHVNVNSLDQGGDTALLTALRQHHCDSALQLLKHGADLSVLDSDGNTTLHLSTSSSCTAELLSRASSLFQDGSTLWNQTQSVDHQRLSVDVRNYAGLTPLHSLSSTPNTADVMEVLVDQGFADINARTTDLRTPLHFAAQLGFQNNVVFLVESGVDLVAVDSNSVTPLMTAIANNHFDMIELFIQGVTSGGELPPLHASVFLSEIEAVSMILDTGVAINSRDLAGRTVLHIAVGRGVQEMILFLLKMGVDVDAVDSAGATALSKAVSMDDIQTAETLVKAGANMLYKTPSTGKPIFFESFPPKGSSAMVMIFLSHGGPDVVFLTNADGQGVLHWIVKANDIVAPALAQEFLELGSAVDGVDARGDTPLTLSCAHGHLDLTALLLRWYRFSDHFSMFP